jgi:hypothetical protein
VCGSALDNRVLLAWPVKREVVLATLAARLGLHGDVRMVDSSLWELGTGKAGGSAVACFFHPVGPLLPAAHAVIAAYRRVLILSATHTVVPEVSGQWLPLMEVFLNRTGRLRR